MAMPLSLSEQRELRHMQLYVETVTRMRAEKLEMAKARESSLGKRCVRLRGSHAAH